MKRIVAQSMLLFFVLVCQLSWAGESAAADIPLKGTASWFGHWHHGKTTASGEPFDMYAMTAAHRTLAFGTILQVTNNSNGRVVVVKVNDRGPYWKKRILDLSFAAADRLDMHVSGTAPITINIVSDKNGRLLDRDKVFFVNLDIVTQDLLTPTNASSRTLAHQHLTQLMRTGFHDAPTLLHLAGDQTILGPFHKFHEAQEILNRVGTLFPKATIFLADPQEVTPLHPIKPIPTDLTSQDEGRG